ncbi:metallophosphoesterase family protein [Periweissella fabalis]|uniref:DNA repair exonuclease n=1 Tax=Periweissella fabalis TaxID=1070421 RepID=A0A7X6N382_9LACO|nr:DNA repair exonuclease [Periweissella fabalis]MCM0598827.1 DNA repair exonuclease [Periweissella fabalis]NKZ24489.1 DNA repair exonuclease [Periweissella fabalis]
MKFIHTADVHLGHPFTGLNNVPNNLMQQVEQATFTSFIKLIDFALANAVDFVVITGDLFDTQHQSVQVLDFLVAQFKRLAIQDIMVYLSFGNHDFNQTIAEFDFGSNVTLFSGDVTVKHQTTQHGESVNIVGFSYQQQHVKAKVIDQFPMKETVDFQIGMYHGAIDGPYAPFSITDMRAKHYDYWALGHIHKRQVLAQQPYIIYPGNLQGQNIKESGMKGFYLVTNQGDRLIPEFIPGANVIWETLTLEIPAVATQNDLLKLLLPKLEKFATEHQELVMTRIDLVSQFALPNLLELRLLDGATVNQLNQELRVNGINQLWINDLTLRQPEQNQALAGLDSQAWDAAAKIVFAPTNIHNTGLKNVPEAFVTSHFDQVEVQSQLQHRAKLLLELYLSEDIVDEN